MEKRWQQKMHHRRCGDHIHNLKQHTPRLRLRYKLTNNHTNIKQIVHSEIQRTNLQTTSQKQVCNGSHPHIKTHHKKRNKGPKNHHNTEPKRQHVKLQHIKQPKMARTKNNRETRMQNQAAKRRRQLRLETYAWRWEWRNRAGRSPPSPLEEYSDTQSERTPPTHIDRNTPKQIRYNTQTRTNMAENTKTPTTQETTNTNTNTRDTPITTDKQTTPSSAKKRTREEMEADPNKMDEDIDIVMKGDDSQSPPAKKQKTNTTTPKKVNTKTGFNPIFDIFNNTPKQSRKKNKYLKIKKIKQKNQAISEIISKTQIPTQIPIQTPIQTSQDKHHHHQNSYR